MLYDAQPHLHLFTPGHRFRVARAATCFSFSDPCPLKRDVASLEFTANKRRVRYGANGPRSLWGAPAKSTLYVPIRWLINETVVELSRQLHTSQPTSDSGAHTWVIAMFWKKSRHPFKSALSDLRKKKKKDDV